MTDKLDEIKNRWADKSWPHIGYFTHTQAVEDIEFLLTEIQSEKIDVEALKKLEPYPDRDDHKYSNCRLANERVIGFNEAIDYLANRGLLRTNEIEPEGRG